MMSVYFVTCMFNPMGSTCRAALYEKFVPHILNDVTGAKLVTVLCTLQDTPIESERVITEVAPNRHWQIEVATTSLLWNKENLLNIGIEVALAQADCAAVCWIDADITFINPRVACSSILKSLCASPVIQAFQMAIDCGEEPGSVNRIQYSTAFSKRLKPSNEAHIKDIETLDHSGYVWASTPEFLKVTHGLMDVCVVGSADKEMLHMILDLPGSTTKMDYTESFRNSIKSWGQSARIVSNMVGYCPLIISHGFHGLKSDRGYKTRSKILQDHQYVPSIHLRKNRHGVLEWSTEVSPALTAAVQDYFKSRKEP